MQIHIHTYGFRGLGSLALGFAWAMVSDIQHYGQQTPNASLPQYSILRALVNLNIRATGGGGGVGWGGGGGGGGGKE